MTMTKTSAATVDQYLTALPENARTTLEKIRKTIKAAVPKAEEVISYQIPTYKYNGRAFIAFAGFKNHCSVFTMSHAVMKQFKDDLKDYDTSGVTIHFPLDKPLPAALVKKLCAAKITENEEKLLAKKNKQSKT